MELTLMASSSVSVPLLLIVSMFTALMVSDAAHIHPVLHISSISAAPATLPAAPISSPATISAAPAVLPAAPEAALSPDITPLLPSPKGGAASPTESSLPIIPSSPSPPNPDDIPSPGPGSGLAPSGALLPESASGSGAVNFPALILCSLAFSLMHQQLHGGGLL